MTWTVEELVRVNSHELTAALLVAERSARARERERWEVDRIERCACGGTRYDGGGAWFGRNARRSGWRP